MAGYVIAEVDVTDPEKLEVYRGQVGATIEKYGGKYVVRGGAAETAEGTWQPKRLGLAGTLTPRHFASKSGTVERGKNEQ